MRSSAGCTCSRPARSKDDEQRQQAVNAIDRNAKIQTRLIEDLLDVSRMIQGRVSLTVAPVDLRSIVDAAVETLRPAAAAKGIAVDVEGADDVLPVIGDEHRLQQVVWNLLANALKYTPRGGHVDDRYAAPKAAAPIVSVTRQRRGHRSGLSPARLRAVQAGRLEDHALRPRPRPRDRATPRRSARRPHHRGEPGRRARARCSRVSLAAGARRAGGGDSVVEA